MDCWPLDSRDQGDRGLLASVATTVEVRAETLLECWDREVPESHNRERGRGGGRVPHARGGCLVCGEKGVIIYTVHRRL